MVVENIGQRRTVAVCGCRVHWSEEDCSCVWLERALVSGGLLLCVFVENICQRRTVAVCGWREHWSEEDCSCVCGWREHWPEEDCSSVWL